MRFYLALIVSKIVVLLIKISRKGSGYTWPGHIALILDPKFLAHAHFQYKKGILLISGTNGKTTTSKLVTHLLTSAGYSVTHNKTGGNILNGIVSTFIRDMSFLGRITSDAAVLEVDEFTLPVVLNTLTPSLLMLLNLSRDQLDRYGEVDIILDKWLEAVARLNDSTVIILDSEQESFKAVSDIFTGRVFYFDSDTTYLEETSLHGTFNAKNINAAVLACFVLGLDPQAVTENLHTFEAAYGRGEILNKGTTHYQLFLAKNPASFNQNLELLSTEKIYHDTLLFILNDEVRDGRDVSWIYDIDAAKLYEVCQNIHLEKIYMSGNRCLDMAVRLHYAGVDIVRTNVDPHLENVVNLINSRNDTNDIFVMPNYSAMLKLRQLLIGREIL